MCRAPIITEKVESKARLAGDIYFCSLTKSRPDILRRLSTVRSLIQLKRRSAVAYSAQLSSQYQERAWCCALCHLAARWCRTLHKPLGQARCNRPYSSFVSEPAPGLSGSRQYSVSDAARDSQEHLHASLQSSSETGKSMHWQQAGRLCCWPSTAMPSSAGTTLPKSLSGYGAI